MKEKSLPLQNADGDNSEVPVKRTSILRGARGPTGQSFSLTQLASQYHSDDSNSGEDVPVSSRIRSIVLKNKAQEASPSTTPQDIKQRALKKREANLAALRQKKKEEPAANNAKRLGKKKGMELYEPPGKRTPARIQQELSDIETEIAQKGSQINRVSKAGSGAQEVHASKDSDMLKQRAIADPKNNNITNNDSAILRARHKAGVAASAKDDTMASSDAEMLQKREDAPVSVKDENTILRAREKFKSSSYSDLSKAAEPDTTSEIARIKNKINDIDSKTESLQRRKSSAMASSDEEMLEKRSKLKPEGTTSSDEEMLKKRSKLIKPESAAKSSSMASSDQVMLQKRSSKTNKSTATIADEKYLKIRRNNSNSQLSNSTTTTSDSQMLQMRQNKHKQGNDDDGTDNIISADTSLACSDSDMLALRRRFSLPDLTHCSFESGTLADSFQHYEGNKQTPCFPSTPNTVPTTT